MTGVECGGSSKWDSPVRSTAPTTKPAEAMMQAPRRPSGFDEEFAMTSMIDVVFLLLVFFIWTSSFDRPEADLRGHVAMRTDSASPNEKVSVAGEVGAAKLDAAIVP